MISTADLELVNYFVFNPKYGQREGEEYKKVFFYYPPKTDEDIQLKNAGLCEALIKFTETFKPDKVCQNFRTEKTKQFLYEAEKDFWLVMTIGTPSKETENSSEESSTKDSSNLIQENVFEAILRKSYRMYKLFCGKFQYILDSNTEEDGLRMLKEKMNNFFIQYLSDLKLQSCDILDVFQGISFLPLGKEPFLHVQSFINMVEAKFKPVRYSAFLYNDQLIWSGINSDDMQIIYKYLIYSLLPLSVDLDLQDGPKLSTANSLIYKYGGFVTKPSNSKECNTPLVQKVPYVYLTDSNGESLEIFYLIVYQVLNATLCLFVGEKDKLTLEFFKSLDSYLGPCLTDLVSEVSEHCLRYKTVSSTSENGPKVLYFNKLNLAQKTTMHTQNKKSVISTVPSDLLRMISDLNAEKSGSNVCGEIMCLTLNDCWLVGRFSNSREFYVIFTQKKGSLIDITEEVKKLCDIQLKGIFFTD